MNGSLGHVRASPALFLCAALHGILAVVCGVAHLADAPALFGVHPALKPFKFAVSIAIYTATMAFLLPQLDVLARTRRALAALVVGTMTLESVVIVGQAFRGTASHFNLQTPLDAALWRAMGAAIFLNTLTMAAVFFLALRTPLLSPGRGPDEARAWNTAWRAGLGLFLLAAVSGGIMGSQLRHTIGAEDGGPGLPFVNWSMVAGDLRVPHFLALHALQALPVGAWVLFRSGVRGGKARVAILSGAFLYGGLCVATLVQALRGVPLLGMLHGG